MSSLIWGMTVAGLVALAAGLVLAWGRLEAAGGFAKILVLGPVFEAVALAMFAMEHFLDARELMGIVPKWLPEPLYWTYFFGIALLAAAVSFVVWRKVRWSGLLLALFFMLVVVTVDLPGLRAGWHDRFFWILTMRETCFAGGAVVLAGSVRGSDWWMRVGRTVVGLILIFYACEHFLHPHHVPGVPLEKMIPAWFPAPVVLATFVGVVLLVAGVGLLFRRSACYAAAGAGVVLVLLTLFFYGPIFLMERHSPLALEGMNYLGDTLLFAATVLLAGLGGVRVSLGG